MEEEIKKNNLLLITLYIIYAVTALFLVTISTIDGNKAIKKEIVMEKKQEKDYYTKEEVDKMIEKLKQSLSEKAEEPIIEELPVGEVIKEPVVVEQPIDYNFDVFQPSGYTEDNLLNALGQSRSGMNSMVNIIVRAEEEYGVNSLYLLATLGLESQWGEYTTGTYNIAGWAGNNGRWSNFESYEHCIMTVAEGLSTHFKNNVGNTLVAVTTMYCPDKGYTNTVLEIMKELEGGI